MMLRNVNQVSASNAPAFPRTRSKSKYDGVGGFARNSTRIPLIDATLYVGGTTLVIWSTLGFARLIWG